MKNVVLAPFPIMNPMFGGAERIFELAHSLGPVTVIALDWEGVHRAGQYRDMNYRQIGADMEAKEQARKLFKLGAATYDGMAHFTRNNLRSLRAAIEEEAPDQIILEHPWLVDFVGDTPYLYDAHNAEAVLTATRWPNSIDAQVVYELEKRAITGAQKITVCSEDDARTLAGLYKVTTPMHLIPNGTHIPWEASEGKTKNLIFIGSLYGPNIRAAQELANLANQLPEYTIQIAGPCSTQVITDAPNVELLGPIDEPTKDWLFRNAYAFVNLMVQGSGTNLKNARAMAYGLPVIASPVGARGFPTAKIIEAPQWLPQALATLDWRTESEKNKAYARGISWEVVGRAFKQIVNSPPMTHA